MIIDWQCAREEIEPRKRVDTRRCAVKTLGLKGVDWEVSHRLERVRKTIYASGGLGSIVKP